MSDARSRNLLKTVPGLLISVFFLWYTFKGISYQQVRSLRIASPAWIVGVVLFSLASYSLRSLRWTRMMRPAGTHFITCARVLMTSLAANNILPLRIGDIMRIFTYAGDLGSTPSFILSTVILEKLLDIFVLALFFVVTMAAGVPSRLRLGAHIALAISAISLSVLLLGARALILPLRRLFARLPQRPALLKLERWLILALECIREIGLRGTLLLIIETLLIWSSEAFVFLSAARLIGLVTDATGPWNAVAAVNLSFLIPSSPGGIGPFEAAAQKSLVSHAADPAQAAVYGLALHVWMLVTITSIGGIIFFYHRYQVKARKSLLNEIETLPVGLP